MSFAASKSLVITQGDRLGVGPELLLMLGAGGDIREGDVVVADPDLLRHFAAALAPEVATRGWQAIEPCLRAPPGCPALDQLQALQFATDLVLEAPQERALVTAPLHKASAQAHGFQYPGHTEYLAARDGAASHAMLMVGHRMKVALATIHLPLAAVPKRLTTTGIVEVGRLLTRALLEDFQVAVPRVGVLGLNPHAGEEGTLGDEEITTVRPAIDALAREFGDAARFFGPLPADSAFYAHGQGDYDALLAMYHDQALAPFKVLHFHDGVNMTLGLSFRRTSPDHGTARDIAGRGCVDPSSMRAAVAIARGEWP